MHKDSKQEFLIEIIKILGKKKILGSFQQRFPLSLLMVFSVLVVLVVLTVVLVLVAVVAVVVVFSAGSDGGDDKA